MTKPVSDPPELLPCPWCGSAARVMEREATTSKRKFFRAYCDADNPPGCPAEPFIYEDTEAEAIATWNRRTPEREPVSDHDIELIDAFQDAAATYAQGSHHRGIRDDFHKARDALIERLRRTPPEREVATEEALDRYRYAIEWVAADSWDHCVDCRERLAWARQMDGKHLTADEIAAIGQKYLGSTEREVVIAKTEDEVVEAVDEALALANTIASRMAANGEHWSVLQKFGAAYTKARAAIEAYERARGAKT